MTLIRPALDYTAKDFDAIAQRLFNVIPSAFPEWTDTQVANFGNLLVELFAYVGDTLLYYQDNQAQESRWSAALLRRSILSGVKLIGYKTRGASAAQATLTFQLASPPVGSVTIAPGDRFSTNDVANPLVFQALVGATIAAGASPAVAFVVVENSVPATELITSSGLPNQTYILESSPYLDGTLTVAADNGSYTVVDDFVSTSPTDRHVTSSLDENSRLHIAFGDAVAGAIPVGTITITYRTGGGVAGNVAKSTIVKPLKNYTDSVGNSVIVRVTNAAKAGGGADIQTVEAIREAAPRELRVLTRTVCREDYEIAALKVPGVARALMLTRDEKPTIQENRGNLYIVPQGGGVATQTMMDAVLDMVTTKLPKTITFKPLVLSASYLTVDVSTKIHLAKNARGATVAAAIKEAVYNFFAINAADGSRNNAIDFGYYMDGAIAWSDVFNVIRDIPGVRKIDDGLGNLSMNGESDDLVIPPERFPLLNSVVVIDAATGAAL